MQQNSPPLRHRWLGRARIWDVLLVLLLAFLAWKWIAAPRIFSMRTAQPAPRVTYPLLDGGTYDLHAQRGRMVFLDFWASWCGPCKASLPLVEGFAKKHPEVDVIAVDVGEPRSLVAIYAPAHGISRVALDPASLSRGFFGIVGYPTMVVVDPQGRIRATWEGFNPAVAANMANAERQLSHPERTE